MNNLLGIVVPTNEPNVAFSHLLDDSSLESLKPASSILTILLNFQPPWTNELINKAIKLIEDKGLSVKWSFNKYELKDGVPPMNRIREDTSRILDCKYYLLADDDMMFRGPSSLVNKSYGSQLLDGIHYMETHETCGLLIYSGPLFKKIPINHIGPTKLDSPYLTGKGIILRSLNNLGGNLLPKDSLELIGAEEEKVMCAWRLNLGMYPARLRCARVMHYEFIKKKSDLKVLPGKEMYNWNGEVLLNNNYKYIKDNFYHDHKLGTYSVVDLNKYLKLGGLDVYDESIVDANTIDYTNLSDDQVLLELKEINNE